MEWDNILKHYYGHSTLKPLQKSIIKAIMKNKTDVLAVLSTGYGKSVCYQLPFILHNFTKCVIVISPLISLMNDQVYSLTEKSIPAITLNSTLKKSEKENEMSKILNDDTNNKIIYISPEYFLLCETFIKQLYIKKRLLFIAIDEAHCVSTWGHDFRSDYQELHLIKTWLPKLPLALFTGTATPNVREDIINSLNISEYYEYVSSFDRPNLFIKCLDKDENILNDFNKYILSHKNLLTIVYVRTRDKTEEISNLLKNNGVNCAPYHAGMSVNERKATQDSFLSGEIKWIIATVAFGMGIDQNIKLVIHYGSPPDLESYYQEIGRAGRDGEYAECVLFYEKSDMKINRILLKDIKDLVFKKYREKQILEMEKYLLTNMCRRKVLLKYFDETFNNESCTMCDNCIKRREKTIEIQNMIQYPMFLFRVLLKYVSDIGYKKLLEIFLGHRNKHNKVHWKSKIFGQGSGRYNKEIWSSIKDLCIINGYVTEETIKSGFGVVLKRTSKLDEWAKNIKVILNNHKIPDYSYDSFLIIYPEIKETFELPGSDLIIKNIIRFDKNKNKTLIEEMIEENEV